MEKTWTSYWILLKSGKIQWQTKEPKNKVFVKEDKTRVTASGDETLHILTHSVTGKVIEFTGHCGYDRGPKLEALIKAGLTT